MTAELTGDRNHPLPRASSRDPGLARHARGRGHASAATRTTLPHTCPRRRTAAHPARPPCWASKSPAGRRRPPPRGGPGRRRPTRCTASVCCSPCPSAGTVRLGSVPSPPPSSPSLDLDGGEVASYTVTGLEAETAVVALELYRRQGAWKVRAVGQGCAGGLAEASSPTRSCPRPTSSRREHPRGRYRAGCAARSIPALRPPPPAHSPGPRDRALTDQAPALPYRRRRLRTTLGRFLPLARRRPGAAGRPAPQPYSARAGGARYHRPAVQVRSPPEAGRSTTATRVGRTCPAPASPAAAPCRTRPVRPAVAGDATGWSMEERLYNQVWGMFEDLARTTGRLPQRRRLRRIPHGKEPTRCCPIPAAGSADRVTPPARAALHRGTASWPGSQPGRSWTGTSPSSSPRPRSSSPPCRRPCAGTTPSGTPTASPWDPDGPAAGDLHSPEADRIRVPMLIRLPLERGLWIDSGRSPSLDGSFADSHEMRRHRAWRRPIAHAAWLLAIYSGGTRPALHVIDPPDPGARGMVAAGARAEGPRRAARPGSGGDGGRAGPSHPARRPGPDGVARRRPGALPPGLDTSQQLLIVNDFPHGFDDRAVNQLRYARRRGSGRRRSSDDGRRPRGVRRVRTAARTPCGARCSG